MNEWLHFEQWSELAKSGCGPKNTHLYICNDSLSMTLDGVDQELDWVFIQISIKSYSVNLSLLIY